MAWKVIYHEAVMGDLVRLGKVDARRILRAIAERIVDGEPDKLGKPLAGKLAGCRRMRVGNTRIVYRVDGHRVEVLIIAVGARRDNEVYNLADKRS
ncbi:type II toxin-antitoxin system RelE family toxin [Pseudomonas citronellolis]|uniref:type II toxin-antitoxin system RelE family toxin n=1 Tax=Pseudomonas citronellolis TaxID=53408 RepID=UPI0023E46D12|nr:type II toxin-antitoxin system RelE/ParE family toxin [Pseudomonas citronellolis]MDF3933541.1 type II toxin-antitoxin system RelE/ParE family toxin [Pseudomonas citronellolis]